MNLAIIGTGYVGLVSGTCLAELGHEVVCVDSNRLKVLTLQRGELPIYEPGLEPLVERNVAEGRLRFTTELESAVRSSQIVMLALPTPPCGDGGADLSIVLEVAGQLGPMLDGYTVIVNKSTVPVGTASRVEEAIAASGAVPGTDFDVVSNPEFLREGVAVRDFLEPHRVVIGSSNPRALALLQQLYEPLARSGYPVLCMDERSAEMTKYAANAFLATKISFVNEVANLCEQAGACIDHVRKGIGTDPRIGTLFLEAGIGYGGSCFPKDVQALCRTAETLGARSQILSAVMEVNQRQRLVLVPRIRRYLGSLAGRRLAVWGLSFKANTDDVRESSALATIRGLVEAGAAVTAYDPAAMGVTREQLHDTISYAPDPYEALADAEALVICTEWDEFRTADLERVRERLQQPAIFDGRNLFDPRRMAALGFHYVSIGRPSFAPERMEVTDSVPLGAQTGGLA